MASSASFDDKKLCNNFTRLWLPLRPRLNNFISNEPLSFDELHCYRNIPRHLILINWLQCYSEYIRLQLGFCSCILSCFCSCLRFILCSEILDWNPLHRVACGTGSRHDGLMKVAWHCVCISHCKAAVLLLTHWATTLFCWQMVSILYSARKEAIRIMTHAFIFLLHFFSYLN